MKTIGKLAAAKIAMAALLFAAFSCFAPAAQAQAVRRPPARLKLVPEDALGFVGCQSASDVDKNVGKLAAALQLPMPGPVAMLKMRAGIQAGLDDNGSAVLAFLPREAAADSTGGDAETHADAFAFVPVTDYAKFIGQFQPEDATAEITTVTIGGGNPRSATRTPTQCSSSRIARTGWPRCWRRPKASNRSSPRSSPGWPSTTHRPLSLPAGLKQMTQQARAGLKKASAAINASGNPQAVCATAAFAMYDSVLEEVGNEVQEVAFGTRVDEGGNMFLDSRWAFVPGTSCPKRSRA